MGFPTLRQIRYAVLFFVVFFAASAVAQFLFVRMQTEVVLARTLQEEAESVNKAVAYNNGVNLRAYNKAWLDAKEYFIVLNDGSLLDFVVTAKGVPENLIPVVECPVLTDAVFKAPTKVSYLSGAKQTETWMLYAKRLDKGYAIVGISEYDDVEHREERLRNNLALFGATLESARQMGTTHIDNNVHWALIDDRGRLINGNRRIPLRTNPMEIGQLSKGLNFRVLGNTNYYTLYSPLIDVAGKQVGTMILIEKADIVSIVMKKLVHFNLFIAALSIATFLALTLIFFWRHEQEKERMREAFQNYFSPQILEAILKEPARVKGGQRREVTVLFSDIRSSTALAERLPPQIFARLLHEYFSAMTDAIFATNGVVDKYMGDALMAFWGAPVEQPDHADLAVRAAIDMTERLHKLHAKWTKEGLPLINTGIGINLGIATVGNFGSDKRYDYTVVGDAVNVAHRLESLNEAFQSHIIISESTKSQLTVAVETRDLGDVQIKGREQPVRAFEVLTG